MKQKRYSYSRLFRDIYRFRGFRHSGIEEIDGEIHISLKRTRKTGKCRNCGRRCTPIGESYKRTVRDINIGPKKCFITFSEEKLRCRCGYRGYEKIDFATPYSRCTVRLEDMVYELTQRTTLKDASEVMGIDWKTVKDIDKRYIEKQLERFDAINPRRIGVDEIAYKKGHKYLTVVRDLDLNCVIWVGIKRCKETLDEFFKELGEERRRNIALVVLDMWNPYIASIRENCPGAEIVFDKFHIIKKVNEALDEIRKKEFAKANDTERRDMKKRRFIILKRKKTLDESQEEELKELMCNNETLYEAYLLKEQISDIFDETDYDRALKRLKKWAKNVSNSDLEPFKAVLNTLKRYSYGIEGYFKHRVTNAGSEGFNTKINIVRRKAYGYWDLDYFILKIFQACGVMRLDVT